jgi:hypothetical protein
MGKYDKLLEYPNLIGVKNAHVAGLLYGYSQFIRFAFIALVFWIASKFIAIYGENQEKTYIATYVMFISALGSGVALANAPGIGPA